MTLGPQPRESVAKDLARRLERDLGRGVAGGLYTEKAAAERLRQIISAMLDQLGAMDAGQLGALLAELRGVAETLPSYSLLRAYVAAHAAGTQ